MKGTRWFKARNTFSLAQTWDRTLWNEFGRFLRRIHEGRVTSIHPQDWV